MRVPTAASGLIPGKSAPLSTAAPAQAALRRLTAGRIRKLPGGGPPRGPSTAVCRHGAIPACSAGSTLRLRQAVAVSMRRPGRSWCTSVAAARQAEGLPGLRRAVTSELERLLGFDSALLEPLPPAVRTAPFLPQAALLPHCRAVVSHPGAGTMLGALCHGLPQLCLPQGTDQPSNTAALLPTGAPHWPSSRTRSPPTRWPRPLAGCSTSPRSGRRRPSSPPRSSACHPLRPSSTNSWSPPTGDRGPAERLRHNAASYRHL
jgi:hypothetical protein